jgi:hypothetical protein
MAAALAYIDAVKAATTARTGEKRIVCEDVIWGKSDLDVTVGRRLVKCASWPGYRVMWQEETFRLKSLFEHAMCNSSKLLLMEQDQYQLEIVFQLTTRGASSHMPVCRPS